jgi:hypothetical protein
MARYRGRGALGGVAAGAGFEGCAGCGAGGCGMDGPVMTSKSKLGAGISNLLSGREAASPWRTCRVKKTKAASAGRLRELAQLCTNLGRRDVPAVPKSRSGAGHAHGRLNSATRGERQAMKFGGRTPARQRGLSCRAMPLMITAVIAPDQIGVSVFCRGMRTRNQAEASTNSSVLRSRASSSRPTRCSPQMAWLGLRGLTGGRPSPLTMRRTGERSPFCRHLMTAKRDCVVRQALL